MLIFFFWRTIFLKSAFYIQIEHLNPHFLEIDFSQRKLIDLRSTPGHELEQQVASLYHKKNENFRDSTRRSTAATAMALSASVSKQNQFSVQPACHNRRLLNIMAVCRIGDENTSQQFLCHLRLVRNELPLSL